MRRPGFDERLVAPHLDFLDQLRAQGLLELNGGFADRSGGAYLLRGLASLAEAEAIVARDPLVVHGASDAVVHEWLAR
ncbi:YciI family protein [Luteimonas sp. SDU101]|uniref:YciI family protein n=1 Tax=Luteimonas sp. SDU101 TaxID=3422593 RepID=UPI003EBDB0D8